MPTLKYHACRLRDPALFEDGLFRRIPQNNGTELIIGRLEGSRESQAQAILYPAETVTGEEARKLAKKRDGAILEDRASLEFTKIPKLETEVSEADIGRLFNGQEVRLEYGSDDEYPTEELRGVEIFAAGTWTDSGGRKKTFRVADLEEMARNHREIGEKVKPFFKMMHLNEKEHRAITAAPALGWLHNLRVKGTRLVADIRRVPVKLAKLIRTGAYRRISIETADRFKDEVTGKIYDNVVTAAGLLGSKLPAITTLKDVVELFGSGYEGPSIPCFGPIKGADWDETFLTDGVLSTAYYSAEYEEPQDKNGGLKMPNLEAKLEALEGKVKTLETANVEQAKRFSAISEAVGLDASDDPGKVVSAIKKLRDDNDKASTALSEFQSGIEKKAVQELIDKAKKEGRLLPRDEALFESLLSLPTDGKFKFAGKDGKETEGTPREAVEAFLASMPNLVDLEKESGEHGEGDRAKGEIPADLAFEMENDPTFRKEYRVDEESQKVNARVLAYAREHKVGYLAAYHSVTGAGRVSDPGRDESDKVSE